MTVASADGWYGYRPWDHRPTDLRPGDRVDPSTLLGPVEILTEFEMVNPIPAPAMDQPRLLGVERTEPGIVDVLGMGADSGLLRGNEGGIESTMRPASGPYQ